MIFLSFLFLRNNFNFLIGTISNLSQAAQLNQTLANQQAMMALYQNAEQLKPAIIKSVIGLLFILIILLFSIAFFRGIIWSNILKQKYDKQFFKRFTILSSIWYILGLALIAIALIIFKLKVGIFIAVILLLLCLYLKLIVNLNFDKNKKMLENLRNIKKGFKRNHLFIPFTFIFTIFLLLFLLLSLIFPGFENKVYVILKSILMIILLVFFVNWARFYLTKVYRSTL